MRIKEYSNAELIRAFEHACFQHCNYPHNKQVQRRLELLEEELAKRLDCSVDEVRQLM